VSADGQGHSHGFGVPFDSGHVFGPNVDRFVENCDRIANGSEGGPQVGFVAFRAGGSHGDKEENVTNKDQRLATNEGMSTGSPTRMKKRAKAWAMCSR
jgi:hypothetical protein